MGLAITQVDAFADGPFAGNPAAVCILSEPREETWMQQVAREMNLSETAFLVPRGADYDLRAGSLRRSKWICAGTRHLPVLTYFGNKGSSSRTSLRASTANPACLQLRKLGTGSS